MIIRPGKPNVIKKITIGWVGDYGNGNEVEKEYSHKSSLNSILFPALVQLKFNIKLVLIGIKEKEDIPEIQQYFATHPHIELEIPQNLDWKNDRWLYDKIREFDIGVSPLLDFEFNKAKSAFKAKQYLSCGVPCIASDVGENSNYITSENGALCKDSTDLKESIERISNLPTAIYNRLSLAAYNSKANFSMDNYCYGLIDTYEKMN